MAEIKLNKRYKYAGDIFQKLIGIGFDVETATAFLNEVEDADVVEVVRCKDCAHYIEMEGFDYKGRKARSCVWHSALRRENDYCSDAIRTPKERGGEK